MMGLWFLIFAMWLIVFVSIRRATHLTGSIPLEDPGIILLLVMLIYLTLPPFIWLLQGGEYISILSGRLYAWQPSYDEQFYLTLLGVTFMFSFVVAQRLYQRARPSLIFTTAQPISLSILHTCLALIGLQFIIFTLLQLSGVIRASNDYGDSYLRIQELPLGLGQFLKILGGLVFFAKTVALVWLFQRWSTHKRLIYAFIAFTVATVDPEGGRSSTFLTFITCLILFNQFVRKLSTREFLLIGFVGILVFSILGEYRGAVESGAGSASLLSFETGLGEFDNLWANAIELRRAKLNGYEIPFRLYLSEIYAPIPSNILPFQKLSYSVWYLDEFYPAYKSAGGGNMFGLLAQLSVGFGLIEAVIRGLLFGWFLSWITRYLRDGRKWWSYPALLYITIWIFYTIRDSSFSIINNVFQVLLVSVFVINLTPKRSTGSKDSNSII
jgi:hypothetical protein